MTDRKNNSSLLSLLFVSLISLSPRLKHHLWKKWYDLLARHDKKQLLSSMNYGYLNDKTLGDHNTNPQLALYEHITDSITLENKNIIEIGSGRGAGAHHLSQKYHPNTYIGIDLANHASQNSNCKNNLDTVLFTTADALSLPLKPGKTDIAINVESSHCYSDLQAFIQQVSATLTEGGYFCYCDLMKANKVDTLRQYFQESELNVIEANNITHNILQSLDRESDRHEQQIKENIPWYLRKAFSDFVGIKNTGVYNLFKTGQYVYYSFLLQK